MSTRIQTEITFSSDKCFEMDDTAHGGGGVLVESKMITRAQEDSSINIPTYVYLC
jgi:tRNA G37 N-methylase TrmD